MDHWSLIRFLVALLTVPATETASKLPMIRPRVEGVFPRGGQVGTDVDVTIRGGNLQQASSILFATPKITARMVSVTHTRIQARFHLEPSTEPGRHDFRIIAPQGSTVSWFDAGTRPEIME